jgi:glucose-6-phosphate 1-dehydrogenase
MKTNDQLEPNIFVIFGGAGDLTWRKLMPALFDLSQSHSIPAHFSIVAVDRVEIGEDALHKRLHEGVSKFARSGKVSSKEWAEFARHIRYLQGDFKGNATYKELGALCASLDKEWGVKAQRIFYMATSRASSSAPAWRPTGNTRASFARNRSGMTWIPRWS